MDNGAESYRRFPDGDEEGLVEIAGDYRDGLILYINSFTGIVSVSEDLAEDTFVRLGIRRPRFSGRSSFRTWLYAIERNTAIDYIRIRSKHETEPIDGLSGLSDGEISRCRIYP